MIVSIVFRKILYLRKGRGVEIMKTKRNLHIIFYSLLSIIIIVLISCAFLNYRYPAVNINHDKLVKILQPGTYTGTSTHGPTEHYKNGLKCKNLLHIYETNDGLSFTNKLKAYDMKTGKFEYSAIRKGHFDYMSNHGKNIFKSSKSYINNNLVSSSYGYAIAEESNSLTFQLTGSWHISGDDFTNILSTMTLLDENKIHVTFKKQR